MRCRYKEIMLLQRDISATLGPDTGSLVYQQYMEAIREKVENMTRSPHRLTFLGGDTTEEDIPYIGPMLPDVEKRNAAKQKLVDICNTSDSNFEKYLAQRALGMEPKELRRKYGYTTALKVCICDNPIQIAAAGITVLAATSILVYGLYEFGKS